MANMAVKKQATTVAAPTRYARDNSKEVLELEALQNERNAIIEEQQDAEETEAMQPEEKTFKKRYGDLRRHAQQKEQDMRNQIRQLEEQLSSATKEGIKLPKSDEEISEWSKQYPDVAKIVETIATKKAQELDSSIEKRLQNIAEREIESNRQRAEVELLQLHPDFDEIRNSEDFHSWVQEQPTWIQKALYENDNDAKAAARAIDLYKIDKEIVTKKVKEPKNNKDAAKSVSTKGSQTRPQSDESSTQIRESDVDKMSAKEYEDNSEAIMNAIRSGNFIYDLSGSAR
jgi:hypothetical protein